MNCVTMNVVLVSCMLVLYQWQALLNVFSDNAIRMLNLCYVAFVYVRP